MEAMPNLKVLFPKVGELRPPLTRSIPIYWAWLKSDGTLVQFRW